MLHGSEAIFNQGRPSIWIGGKYAQLECRWLILIISSSKSRYPCSLLTGPVGQDALDRITISEKKKL